MNQEAVDRSPALSPSELEAFQSIISALNPLPNEARRRLLDSAATLLRIEQPQRGFASTIAPGSTSPVTPSRSSAPFSADTEMSPKEFLFEKKPRKAFGAPSSILQ